MNRRVHALAMLICLALLAGAYGCSAALSEANDAQILPFEVAVMVADGSGGAVATLATTGIDTGTPGQVSVTYTLANHGLLALTQLDFTVMYLDGDGRELRERPIEVLMGFMTEPVQPGETRTFERRHYFDGAEKAVAVRLAPICVRDEVELMPWTEPQPGNLLLDFCNYPPFTAYFDGLDINPPVEMVVHVDEREDQVITDVEVILAEIESLKQMRIGEESDVRVTDSGIGYRFTMADGSQWSVSFEAPGLFCWHGRVYEVIHD